MTAHKSESAAAHDTHNMAEGQTACMAAAQVLAPPAPAKPPFVQAEVVRIPRPPTPSRDDADAARQVRAARRRELLGVFFQHQPGALRAKREQAYALLQRVVDPIEHERLRALLGNLWSTAQSAPPPEGL